MIGEWDVLREGNARPRSREEENWCEETNLGERVDGEWLISLPRRPHVAVLPFLRSGGEMQDGKVRKCNSHSFFPSPRATRMPPRIRSITPDSEELDELEPSGESEFEQESEQEDELEELRSPAPAPSALKIKFKLSTATYDPPATSKGKGKQRQVSEEEELSEFDSDEDPEDHYSDQSAQSSMSAAKLTARQRAKEMGEDHGMELQSLPPGNRFSTSFPSATADSV